MLGMQSVMSAASHNKAFDFSRGLFTWVDSLAMMAIVARAASTIRASRLGSRWHKKYILRVPPRCQTPEEAVAWTFGMNAWEYRPEVET
jgi:Uri superfamily endonuclease